MLQLAINPDAHTVQIGIATELYVELGRYLPTAQALPVHADAPSLVTCGDTDARDADPLLRLEEEMLNAELAATLAFRAAATDAEATTLWNDFTVTPVVAHTEVTTDQARTLAMWLNRAWVGQRSAAGTHHAIGQAGDTDTLMAAMLGILPEGADADDLDDRVPDAVSAQEAFGSIACMLATGLMQAARAAS